MLVGLLTFLLLQIFSEFLYFHNFLSAVFTEIFYDIYNIFNVFGVGLMFFSKKGIAAWLSWVLIISFSVVLGLFMMKWMTGFSTRTTEKMMSRVEESDCSLIGVSVLDACQTVEELDLTLKNKKSLNVDQLVINYIDIYDNPGTKIINVTLRVNREESLSILKQGIIKQFDIVPRSFTDDKIISCSDNTVVVNNIKQCGMSG